MGLAAVAAIGAVGAIGGGLIASSGAKSAANASAAAADRSSAVQQQIYGENKQTLAPYVQTGIPATQQINNLLGLGSGTPASVDWNAYAQANPDLMAAYNAQQQTPYYGGGWQADASGGYGQATTRPDLATFAQQWQQQHGGNLTPYTTPGQSAAQQAQAGFDLFKNSTGYDWRLKQGMNALNSGYAGAGTIKSGAAMKAAIDYGQGQASQEFGNYLGALGAQQGVGLQAAGAQAGVATNYANSLGNIYQQNGANQANAALAKANALGGAVNGVAGSIGGILGYKNGMWGY